MALTGDEDMGVEDSIEAEATTKLVTNVWSVERLDILPVTADTTHITKKKLETDGAQSWERSGSREQ